MKYFLNLKNMPTLQINTAVKLNCKKKNDLHYSNLCVKLFIFTIARVNFGNRVQTANFEVHKFSERY